MSTIIEQVLQLPKEEKLELLYALQEDLDDEIEENNLTKEQWEEVERRHNNIENDTSQFISGDEFLIKWNDLKDELRCKRP